MHWVIQELDRNKRRQTTGTPTRLQTMNDALVNIMMYKEKGDHNTIGTFYQKITESSYKIEVSHKQEFNITLTHVCPQVA